MQGAFNRRTAMKVKDGRVQRKDRRSLTSLERLVIDRESPGAAFRHVISKRDVLSFIELIPNWERLSERLERIVLSARDNQYDGYYDFYHREETGAIFLNAWDKDLWVKLSHNYFSDHQDIFERLGVSFDCEKENVFCRFTEAQARAFTLLHVFLHELGHHFDRLNQKHRDATRGEEYAENFARRQFDAIHRDYLQVFGDPARTSS
jgi:hypothetical protein